MPIENDTQRYNQTLQKWHITPYLSPILQEVETFLFLESQKRTSLLSSTFAKKCCCTRVVINKSTNQDDTILMLTSENLQKQYCVTTCLAKTIVEKKSEIYGNTKKNENKLCKLRKEL